MSEETTQNSAETPAVEPVAAPAPATTPAPEAAAAEAPKKEVKRDIFAEIGGGEEEIKIHKAKGSKNITRGIVHVTATFNNTLVSVTDTPRWFRKTPAVKPWDTVSRKSMSA